MTRPTYQRPRPARARPQDWPERLAAHIAAHRASEFAWGRADCATFTADWVAAMHGTDPLAGLRGAYGTEAEYLAMADAHGSLSAMAGATAALHGLPECPPAYAQRGDIALVRLGNEECLGIVDALAVTVPTLAGIRLAPRRGIVRAWSV